MAVTAEDLKSNLEEYLRLAEREDIDITSGGKVIARLTSPCRQTLQSSGQSPSDRRARLETEGGEPNAETLEAIEEVKRMKADPSIGKAYTDVKLMIKELLSDV